MNNYYVSRNYDWMNFMLKSNIIYRRAGEKICYTHSYLGANSNRFVCWRKMCETGSFDRYPLKLLNRRHIPMLCVHAFVSVRPIRGSDSTIHFVRYDRWTIPMGSDHSNRPNYPTAVVHHRWPVDFVRPANYRPIDWKPTAADGVAVYNVATVTPLDRQWIWRTEMWRLRDGSAHTVAYPGNIDTAGTWCIGRIPAPSSMSNTSGSW